jgi:hypothetical protein
MDSTRRMVKGRAVEVDLLENGAGFVLSIGPVSLWLGPALAADVLETLARAVAVEKGEQVEAERDAPSPQAALRRRIFS